LPTHCTATTQCLYPTADTCKSGMFTPPSAGVSDVVFGNACGCGTCTIMQWFQITLTSMGASMMTNGQLTMALAGAVGGNVAVISSTNGGPITIQVTSQAAVAGDGSSTVDIQKSLLSSGIVAQAQVAMANVVTAPGGTNNVANIVVSFVVIICAGVLLLL